MCDRISAFLLCIRINTWPTWHTQSWTQDKRDISRSTDVSAESHRFSNWTQTRTCLRFARVTFIVDLTRINNYLWAIWVVKEHETSDLWCCRALQRTSETHTHWNCKHLKCWLTLFCGSSAVFYPTFPCTQVLSICGCTCLTVGN